MLKETVWTIDELEAAAGAYQRWAEVRYRYAREALRLGWDLEVCAGLQRDADLSRVRGVACLAALDLRKRTYEQRRAAYEAKHPATAYPVTPRPLP